MKLKGINIKAGAIILMASVIVAFGAMLICTNQCFADYADKMYSDENVSAHVNADGSGFIEISDPTFFGWDSDSTHLTQIAGTPISEIIKFSDGTSVNEIGFKQAGKMSHGEVDLACYFINNLPEGQESGMGKLIVSSNIHSCDVEIADPLDFGLLRLKNSLNTPIRIEWTA